MRSFVKHNELFDTEYYEERDPMETWSLVQTIDEDYRKKLAKAETLQEVFEILPPKVRSEMEEQAEHAISGEMLEQLMDLPMSSAVGCHCAELLAGSFDMLMMLEHWGDERPLNKVCDGLVDQFCIYLFG